MTIPTMNKMAKVYAYAATIERVKCGRPNERSVQNTMKGFRRFRGWLNTHRERLGYERIGFEEDFPLVSIIKPQLIHEYLAEMLNTGVKPVTAVSYMNQLQSLFAKWVRPYYEDRGWKVPAFPSFGAKARMPRYTRPNSDQLQKLKSWYETLSTTHYDRNTKFTARRRQVDARELWFAATMMLDFAMRNSDIMRLTSENFVEHGGRVYLNYTPHKTENSSGRMVKWPVHSSILDRLQAGVSIALPSLDMETFDALNRQMRSLGFTGTKGAYELRKICIDHVYQRYGAEMATSISGDDIKTIMHYYADPSQPNIGDVRVTDLL